MQEGCSELAGVVDGPADIFQHQFFLEAAEALEEFLVGIACGGERRLLDRAGADYDDLFVFMSGVKLAF